MPLLLPNEYRLGPRGEALIKSFESYSSEAYMPTPNDVPTIGWGHTKGVRMGDVCTLTQAEQWFRDDTADAVNAVATLSVRLTQAMFDALVSLVFNVGANSIRTNSTIGVALRNGDYYAAWIGFTLWRKQRNYSNGKLENLRGLARRRAQEMALFMEDRF